MMTHELEPLFQHLSRAPAPLTRPYTTLAFAQSLDGSIAAVAGRRLALAGSASMKMTHRLRATHDAVLIGIGTALADNPRLNVRLAEGRDPQPIIVDSHLRLPLDAGVMSAGKRPWIACLRGINKEKAIVMKAAGVRVVPTQVGPDGRLDLKDLMRILRRFGVRRLMVEGGGGIITSLLARQLADLLVLTIAPCIVGGFHGVGDLPIPPAARIPRLRTMESIHMGPNVVIWGEIDWRST